MPFQRGNKAAANRKRVKRERIAINMGFSYRNGTLGLIVEHLSRQGIEPTEENIKDFVRDWVYLNLPEYLKKQIETSDNGAIIV